MLFQACSEIHLSSSGPGPCNRLMTEIYVNYLWHIPALNKSRGITESIRLSYYKIRKIENFNRKCIIVVVMKFAV